MKFVKVFFVASDNESGPLVGPNGPAQFQILTTQELQQGGQAGFEQIVLQNAREFWNRWQNGQ